MEIHLWFNLISLVCIIIFGIKGLMNGFIKEIFGLVGIIGGIFIAARFAQKCGEFISDNVINIQNTSSVYIVGFVAILLSFWIICILFGIILSKIISFSALTTIDRVLGFVFGGLKFFLILSVIITAMSYISFIKDNMDKYFKDSFMYESSLKTGNFIINLDYSNIDNTMDDISSKIKEDIKPINETIDTINDEISNKTDIFIESFMKNNDE